MSYFPNIIKSFLKTLQFLFSQDLVPYNLYFQGLASGQYFHLCLYFFKVDLLPQIRFVKFPDVHTGRNSHRCNFNKDTAGFVPIFWRIFPFWFIPLLLLGWEKSTINTHDRPDLTFSILSTVSMSSHLIDTCFSICLLIWLLKKKQRSSWKTIFAHPPEHRLLKGAYHRKARWKNGKCKLCTNNQVLDFEILWGDWTNIDSKHRLDRPSLKARCEV